MKADEPRQNRIPFMLSDAELEAIDTWRFDNRINTRAEAIRRLVQIGLVFDARSMSIRKDLDLLQSTVDEVRSENVRLLDTEEGELRDLKFRSHLICAVLQIFNQLEPLMRELYGQTSHVAMMRGDEKTSDLIERSRAVSADYFRYMEESFKDWDQPSDHKDTE
jgi:hypothetical protein